MANPYQAGQALGTALFGSTEDTYTNQLGRQYQVEQALQQARQARSKAVLADQNVVSRQGLTADLIGRARAGDVSALNELTALGLTSNENVDMKTLGETQEFAFRQAARDKAVLGDPTGYNAELVGIAKGPLQTTSVSDGVAFNPYAQSDQNLNVTPLGEASIAQRRAAAASSYASANNSNASAAKTRQDMTLGGQKFALERGGRWNPSGKSSGGGEKPIPVGALNKLLEVEDALGGTAVLNDIIKKNADRIKNGTLKVGPADTLGANFRTALNMSTDEDVARKEWQADLTKIVNESLRLNKGVQTEGDAQRAADELMAAGDQRTVSAALKRLAGFNRRAVELQQRKQGIINSNYGRGTTLGDSPSGGVDDLLGKYGIP